MAKASGFSLSELLLVGLLLGMLTAIALPGFLRARSVAEERAALLHAQSVYRAAWAYIGQAEGNPLAVGDCSEGYTIGSYSVPNPGHPVKSCSVWLQEDGTPQVEVLSQSGRRYRLP